MIRIDSCDSNASKLQQKWNQFVLEHPEGCCYHLLEWKDIIQRSFGLLPHYLYALDEEEKFCGILPMMLSRSILFGTYLTSVPFYNYGGILAQTEEARDALLEKASSIAKYRKATHIELRHCKKLDLPLPTKTHKVRMVLELPNDPEVLWKSFKAKLRSQIKRAQRENMSVTFGGKELIEDFYQIFSENMRDLGTPVWTKKIFYNVLKALPQQATICLIYLEKEPVAAGFLIGFKEYMEIPSASSIRKYNRLSPNMLLYWSVLEFACKKGYKYFDFGRSSLDSGTYKFKKQWGAKPEILHWQYWLAEGREIPEINPQNPKYQRAIQTWQKLPLSLSKIIGPFISCNLP